MRRPFLLLALLAFLSTSLVNLQAQNELYPCGNDNYFSSWLRAYQENPNRFPRTDDILYLPVKIHLVGTDEGNGYMSEERVLRSFCTLNEDFAESNIQFFIQGDFNYLNNTSWYDHVFSNGFQMMNQNNFPNAINCYIVDSPAGNCGYYAPGPDAIALAKGCTQPNDHTWAHEIGHYLSLPHTFFGWEFSDEEHDYSQPAPAEVADWPVELSDGSNCQVAADGFCDTPADYLDYRWSCNNQGESSVVQMDPDSVAFQSDGSFFMSYSNSNCKSRFSQEQSDAMRANVTDFRSNLITPAPVDEIVIPEQELIVLSPMQGEFIEGSQTVTLAWEPVPNATHYLVQINPFNIFSIIFNQFIVEEPSLTFSGLESDDEFFWRVRPFNPYYTCTGFSEPASFETGLINSTQELLPGEQVQVFPNPVSGGELTVMVTTTEAPDAQWFLTDALGRTVRSGQSPLFAGNNYLKVDTESLPAGLYSLRLQLDERQSTQKVMVQ